MDDSDLIERKNSVGAGKANIPKATSSRKCEEMGPGQSYSRESEKGSNQGVRLSRAGWLLLEVVCLIWMTVPYLRDARVYQTGCESRKIGKMRPRLEV